MKKAYSIFHLNLAYSSIEVEERIAVIEKCYFPLLDLIETMNVPMGIEMSAWTLEQIQIISPQWVQKFRSLMANDLCELVGSGYVQLIAPLVPYEVNYWNQCIAWKTYRNLLGLTPNIALVNEMAFSSSLLGLYEKIGYSGIVLDRANIEGACSKYDVSVLPTYSEENSKHSIAILWSDTILFQKFQRYVHGDITLKEYLDFISNKLQDLEILPVYCNDAEIFDYRPGRYLEESEVHSGGEWRRMMGLYDSITSRENLKWCLPSKLIEKHRDRKKISIRLLSTIKHPIPTKKQAKYNISRWAASGRNDIWLNTVCHRIYKKLKENVLYENKYKKQLCKLWSSDYRTHITQRRWQNLCDVVKTTCNELDISTDWNHCHWFSEHTRGINAVTPVTGNIKLDRENIYLTVETTTTKLVLNVRRGLAIKALSFASHDNVPVIGTISHGHFDNMDLGVDLYSGHLVMEYPTHQQRITDLQRVQPCIFENDSDITITADIHTVFGRFKKRIVISKATEQVEVGTLFKQWPRSFNTVRAASVTLLPNAFSQPLHVCCRNGGEHIEHFALNTACLHASPASTLVTSSAGFGATDGVINIGDKNRSIDIEWDNTQCAAFPMLHFQPHGDEFLARLVFSLSELDDTYKPGGYIPSFRQKIRPK